MHASSNAILDFVKEVPLRTDMVSFQAIYFEVEVWYVSIIKSKDISKLIMHRGTLSCTVLAPAIYPIYRVPTQPGKPGKPGKMRVHLENLEISWNFEKFNKYHGKMT